LNKISKPTHDIYETRRSRPAEPQHGEVEMLYWKRLLLRHRMQNFLIGFLAFLAAGALVAFTVQQYRLTQEPDDSHARTSFAPVNMERSLALLLDDDMPSRDRYLLDQLREARMGSEADAGFAMQWLKDAAHHLLEGELAERQLRVDDAMNHYEQLMMLFPDQLPLHARMGLLHLQRENYLAAASSFERALQGDAAPFGVINNLAAAYLQLGRMDDAERFLQQAVTLRPNYAPARYNLAMLYVQRQDTRRAADQFQRYLQLDPDNLSATLSYAAVLIGAQAWEQAAPILERAAELSPDMPPIHFRLAQCYARTQRPREAVRAMEQILPHIDPRQALAWLSRDDFDSIRQEESFQRLIARLATR